MIIEKNCDFYFSYGSSDTGFKSISAHGTNG
jgi:hypothetical protein